MQKSNSIKIGYFQYLPKFLEIRNNLADIRNLLKQNQNKINQLDLIVFPEYFLSGPIKLDMVPDYENQMSSNEIRDSLKKFSKTYPSTVFVMGSVLFKKQGQYFNSCLVLRNGKILAEYHKKALIYQENYLCHSDNKEAIFKVGKTKIGIAICWDLILPEVFRKYTKQVDLMIVPAFWGISGNALQSQYSFSLEKKYYDALGIARAYENAYALLFVNSVGKYASSFYSDRMMGGSYFVIPPLGLIHKTNDKNPSRLQIIEFNTKPLSLYRKFYATDKDYFHYLSKKII